VLGFESTTYGSESECAIHYTTAPQILQVTSCCEPYGRSVESSSALLVLSFLVCLLSILFHRMGLLSNTIVLWSSFASRDGGALESYEITFVSSSSICITLFRQARCFHRIAGKTDDQFWLGFLFVHRWSPAHTIVRRMCYHEECANNTNGDSGDNSYEIIWTLKLQTNLEETELRSTSPAFWSISVSVWQHWILGR